MKVIFSGDNANLLVQVEGRVDTTTAGEFQNQVLAAMKAKPTQLTLDCGKLEYISSAGLRSLLIMAKTAKVSGTTIYLSNLTDFVREVLATSGFDALFKII